jgi:type IV fimbrial biogenesis protein FimT
MGKKHQEGFTLIELFVLMMVVALTLSLGIPAFNAMTATSRMSAAANDLVSSLHAARGEALTRSRSVTLCASSDWDTERPDCDPTASLLAGWVVFVDADTDGTIDATEAVLQAHGPLHDSIRLQPGSRGDHDPPHYLSFRADGFLQDIPGLAAGLDNIQLCDPRGAWDDGNDTAAGRWITLSPAGRPALIEKTSKLEGADNPLAGCGS